MPRVKKKPETIENLSATVAGLKRALESQRRIIDQLVYQGHNQHDLIVQQERRVAELQQLIHQLATSMETQSRLSQSMTDVIRQSIDRINSLEEWRLETDNDDYDEPDDDEPDDDGPIIKFSPSAN